MAATTLPRPSRPLCNPPTGPLPSLPIPKQRKSSSSSVASISADSKRSSSSSLLPPTATSYRAVSSSAILVRPSLNTHANSTSALPTINTKTPPASPLLPGKTLRKTISIGSFPQPPRGISRVGQCPPSPLSNSSSPTSAMPAESRLTPTVKKLPTKRVVLGGRTGNAKSPLSSRVPSGSGVGSDTKPTTNLLSLPSPPQSRNSSAQGSYANSATTFEDIDEEETRTTSVTMPIVSKPDTDKPTSAKDGKGNVIVSVRVRPDLANGDNTSSELEWMVDGRRSLISYKGKEGGQYLYDNVFAAHDNNSKVYDAAAKRLVRRVMEGYHGTVFAYGMTGTGKTFSMQGTATSPGVIPLAITDIFSFIRETPHREFLLRVSYLEIYNERIHDLLSAPANGAAGQPANQEEIKLREDPKRGVYATPLKEEIVQSPTQLLRVIARGDNARRVAGTQFNARSSRSHAVVQIVVESRERVPGVGTLQDTKRTAITPGGVRVSTLSLIDLAGSEKAAESKERRTEGAHINKSLLTLGTVIGRLSGDKDKDKDKSNPASEKHLPYRDSKLTRLLQPALSGGSLVSILCTIQIGSAGSIATATNHTNETLNTLKFASRAKNNIVSHAKKAEEALGSGGDAGSRALLDRYRMEILELRKQLEQQQQHQGKELVVVPEKSEEEEKAKEIEAEQRHEEQMLEMQLARTALKERIEHLNRLILSSKSLGVNSGRSFSSMSVQRHNLSRVSLASIPDGHPVSARSSLGHTGLEVPSQKRASSGSTGTPGNAPNSADHVSEDEDSLGENGDGTASFQSQIRSLRADLDDKNRYIGTLEKRLLHARRSSQSRTSISLNHRSSIGEDGGVEALLRDKDAEIADLRARLDDKDRMLDALRSAARKRDVADSTASTPAERRKSAHRKEGSMVSTHSKVKSSAPSSPVRPASKDLKAKAEDRLTKMLDEMIQEKVNSGAPFPNAPVLKPPRKSNLQAVNENRVG